jgi:hypothetical protein
MFIEQLPQISQVGCVIVLVVGNSDPLILVVNDHRFFFILRHNKTTYIILRRIHQVAQYLLLTPFAGRRFIRHLVFRDSMERCSVLVNDRFGMRPCYYAQGPEGQLLFASEIKAFGPWFTPALDEFSISSYLLGFGGPK